MEISKRNNTQQLAFSAIITSLTLIFVILGTYIPFFFIVLVLFLPIFSALVFFTLKIKYYLLYFLGTIVLSFILNLSNFDVTLFTLIPSLLIGLIIAFAYKIKIPHFYIPLLSALLMVFNFYLSLPVISFIYNADFLNIIFSLLKLETNSYSYTGVFILVYALSFVQSTITNYIIIETKFIGNLKTNGNYTVIDHFVMLTLSLLTIVFMFINDIVGLSLLLSLVYLTLYIMSVNFKKAKKLYSILTIFGLVLVPFVYALFEQIKNGKGVYGLILIVLIIEISTFLWLHIHMRKQKND